MASIGWALLLFLPHLHTLLSASTVQRADGSNLSLLPVPFLCHPDQAKSLLQLKKSFSFHRSTTRLSSWQSGTDCCLWEGVDCDPSSGHVTTLDLNNRGLVSHGLPPALFDLISLRQLDLSMNDLGGYSIPATGVERFSFLTHMNLSNSCLFGRIPIGISKLVNLLSLDLSYYYFDNDYYDSSILNCNENNLLWDFSFDTLVANLSSLRELYLDGVDLSHSGEEWGTSLATYVPHLEILSMTDCGLSGPIHKSLSRLHSLVVVNLQENYGITASPFPELFFDFLNLTTLQLSNTNLEGWFPTKPFQSKNMRVLDLSGNQNLSGNLLNFSNASSLETLRLDWTNFSYAKLISSLSDFKSLKHLSLDGNFTVDFLPTSTLGSLCQLDLNLWSVSELGSIFSWIGQQKKLMSLTLYGGNFSTITPNLVSNFKTLRTLRIQACFFPSPILSAIIGNLMDLQTLEITGAYGSIPTSIGNLTNLRNMRFEACLFSSPMPATIGKLTNLRNLFIDDCFSDPMPTAIGNLTNLETMQIFGLNISGSISYAIGRLSKLRFLDLTLWDVSGGIPSSIVNLTQLTMLDLSSNSLNGEIPSSIFNLPVLRYLDLSFNQLSGRIQDFDTATSQLETLYLNNNELSGFIPEAFFELTSLVSIDVSSNNLIGSVDLSHFQRLSDLTVLDLSYNKLQVMDTDDSNPVGTSYLAGLDHLGLASCNITRFPKFLRHVKLMSYLDLSCNKISGDVPNWVWETTWSVRESYLNLSHNMFTGMQINSAVLPFNTPMEVVDLSFNRLSGQIPMPKSSGLVLAYSNNTFSSLLPNWTLYLADTIYFSISKNNINSHVPPSICEATHLDVLDLSDNNFSGPIPSCVIENVSLSVLNLRNNLFQGTLPSSITTRCSLQTIDLHGNEIEGQLPRGLSNCSNLEILDLGSNRIADTFPSWLRVLPRISVLVLRSNQLYGTIGDIVGDRKCEECFPSLQIIDLAWNNFSGNLSPQFFKRLKSMMAEFNSSGETLSTLNTAYANERFYQYSIDISYKGEDMPFPRMLTTVTAIDFSNNRLEGSIPESFGSLVSLRVLSLSHNGFTGKIPAQLGSMTDLESLDLSSNQLSGEIPEELTKLTFLGSLNLSNNHLVGPIPQSGQLSTFDSSSFGGNTGLCGLQLPESPCAGSPHTPSVAHVSKSSRHVDVVLFLFIGLGFGVGFAAAVVVRWGQISRWFTATAMFSVTVEEALETGGEVEDGGHDHEAARRSEGMVNMIL